MAVDGADTLHLLVAGRAYQGWQGVRLTRSLEHCAGAFELSLSEVWPGSSVREVVRAGQRCEVLVGSDTVATGYVDVVDLQVTDKDHEVTVAGRDATADLVDCSAVARPGQWRGKRVEQIAAELAAPFGVQVRAEVDTGAVLDSFALQTGEAVFDAIERAARLRALLLVSDGRGGLVITRAGVRRVPGSLVLGKNIISMRVRNDLRDRFSSYTALGQAPANDYFSGEAAASIRAVATDAGVARHRPLVITNDGPDRAASLQQRVRWEANVRAARSLDVEVIVQGWRHPGGLWEPNSLVSVRAAAFDLEAELLITDVEASLDEHGTRTRLSMTRADAYRLLPAVATSASTSSSAAGGSSYFDVPKTGATK